jgi:hypothetical protein
VGLGLGLGRPDVQVTETVPLAVHPFAVVGVKTLAGESPGLPGCADSCGELAVSECAFGSLHTRGCGLPVHPRAVRQAEAVGAERRRQHRRAVQPGLAEHPPQLRDDGAERRGPRGRQSFAPQQLGQLLTRDRAVPLAHEVGQHEAALPARQERLGQAPSVHLDPHCPTQRDAQHQRDCPRPAGSPLWDPPPPSQRHAKGRSLRWTPGKCPL